MNKLTLISHGSQITEVVTTPLVREKLKRLKIEVLELQTTFERPLSFRVLADKYLVNWLNLDYQTIKQSL